MTFSRRSLLTGLSMLALAGVRPRAAAAAKPTITVHKEPT